LAAQSIYGNLLIWSFFGFQVFLALFIFLNIFTAVIVEGILPRPSQDEEGNCSESEYSSNVTNYRLLRELFCGVCLLSEYVSQKQTHPDDKKSCEEDLESGPKTVGNRHDEMMKQFLDMTHLVKHMSSQMDLLRREVRESRGVPIHLDSPDGYYHINSV
jgi:hypothetical protein